MGRQKAGGYHLNGLSSATLGADTDLILYRNITRGSRRGKSAQHDHGDCAVGARAVRLERSV